MNVGYAIVSIHQAIANTISPDLSSDIQHPLVKNLLINNNIHPVVNNMCGYHAINNNIYTQWSILCVGIMPLTITYTPSGQYHVWVSCH